MAPTPSTYANFLQQAIDLVKGSASFRERLGLYHDESNFADPDNVTESESLKFIWGEDNGFFLGSALEVDEVQKTAYGLMPFCEVGSENHTETNPGGSCGEDFRTLDTGWSLIFMDKARETAQADVDADPLASMKDFYAWAGGILEDLKAANANADYVFDSIELMTPVRTDPEKRTSATYDYWYAVFKLSLEEG